MIKRFFAFVRSFFRDTSLKRAVDEEIEFHIEMTTEANIRKGLSPLEARQNAMKQFGRIQNIRERCYDERSVGLCEKFVQDIRYGARIMIKNRAFSLMAVVTLGLGISANTAIFTVVNSQLFRQLPYPEADKLMQLWQTNPLLQAGLTRERVAWNTFITWQKNSKSFESLAAWQGEELNLISDNGIEKLRGPTVTANYFDCIGVRPLLGRAFEPNDQYASLGAPIVLSHDFWQRKFAGDSDVIGKTILFENGPRLVIGVMPATMNGIGNQGQKLSFWSPLNLHRPDGLFEVVGRLKKGVSEIEASEELTAILKEISLEDPKLRGWKAALLKLHEEEVLPIRSSLWMLLIAASMLLLMACANVGNMLLTRALGRQREFAIRGAIGASLGRVTRQLFTEGLLLGCVGGGIGLVLTSWGLPIVLRQSPEGLLPSEVKVEPSVILYTAGLSLIMGLVFSMAPVIQACRVNVNDVLNDGSRGSSGGHGGYFQNGLIIAQIALAILLLVSAALFIQSFRSLQRVELGYHPQELLYVGIDRQNPRSQSRASQIALVNQLLDAVRGVPGVKSAATTTSLPLKAYNFINGDIQIEGLQPEEGQTFRADISGVSPGYFETMGISVKQGRGSERGDQSCIVINQSMARRWFKDGNAIGKQIRTEHWGGGEKWSQWYEIVGVVDDTRSPLDFVAKPHVFVPYEEYPGIADMLVIRTAGSPQNYLGAVKEALLNVDKRQTTQTFQTMERRLDDELARNRFNTWVTTAFASVALAIGTAGIYGVMAYSTAQRRREIAVRMASGATPGDIVKLVMQKGCVLISCGVGIGLILVFISFQIAGNLINEIQASYSLSLALAPILLAIVAAVACLVPTITAIRISPIEALKAH